MRRRLDLAVFTLVTLIITGCTQAGSSLRSANPAVTTTSSTSSTSSISSASSATASSSSVAAAVNDARALAIAADGGLWAVTRGGVVRWDLATRTARVFLEADGLPTRQRPEALGPGYMPPVLTIGRDAVFGVGGRGFVPVIARSTS
jgi:hypothetical protein